MQFGTNPSHRVVSYNGSNADTRAHRNRMHPVMTFAKPAAHFPDGGAREAQGLIMTFAKPAAHFPDGGAREAQGLKQQKLASATESEETPPRATSTRAQKHAPGDEASLGLRRCLYRHKRWQLVVVLVWPRLRGFPGSRAKGAGKSQTEREAFTFGTLIRGKAPGRARARK